MPLHTSNNLSFLLLGSQPLSVMFKGSENGQTGRNTMPRERETPNSKHLQRGGKMNGIHMK